jgi:ribonuclease HI
MSSIFCDGACRGNGTARAIAGWAWAYWPGLAVGEPERYGAARLGEPATNQRAELMALLEALRWWSGGAAGPITIYTDSMYTINCTSKWGAAWRKKGWKRDSGEPLQNLDIIRPLVELWQPKWRLVHVRGHQTAATPEAHGNNWVDRAAVVASQGELVAGPIIRMPPPSPAAAPVRSPTLPASTSPASTSPAPTLQQLFGAAAPAKKESEPTRLYTRQTDLRRWFGGQ